MGSAFRTANGAGVSKVYLTGYTPAPIDRFGRIQKDIKKVALGAEKSIEWEHNKNVFDVIENMKKQDIDIVSVEQSSDSIDYVDFVIKKPTVFVFGNEVDGLSEKILKISDSIIEIPMLGTKESLNVSVSVGIILFSAIK